MDFDTWLTQHLLELKTDEAVFGPYIKSIVEGDEDDEDKIEALDGILAELGVSSLDVEALRKEILSRWEVQKSQSMTVEDGSGDAERRLFEIPKESEGASNNSNPKAQAGAASLDTQLEKLLNLSPEELTGARGTPSKGLKELENAPDSALRAAILKQYLQDENDSDDEDGGGGHKAASDGGMGGLSKNTNAERVLSEQREQKERSKADAAKKREKDREDRAKQKKLAEERKEKAKKKATKVERKR